MLDLKTTRKLFPRIFSFLKYCKPRGYWPENHKKKSKNIFCLKYFKPRGCWEDCPALDLSLFGWLCKASHKPKSWLCRASHKPGSFDCTGPSRSTRYLSIIQMFSFRWPGSKHFPKSTILTWSGCQIISKEEKVWKYLNRENNGHDTPTNEDRSCNYECH